MIARMALVLALLSACAPWYRDDELRALHAEDPQAIDARVSECERRTAEDAVACFEAAVAASPRSGRSLVGLARALVAVDRLAEARAVAERGLTSIGAEDAVSIAGAPDGAPSGSGRELAALLLGSYAREQLYAGALDVAARRGKPSLDEAATQYPEVFGKLAQAQRAAGAGQTSEALALYAGWLADYGTPDHPLLREWADAVLGACAPLTEPIMARADREASAGNAPGALVAYGQAFRYLPSARVEAELRHKLVATAAQIVDPSWLSPQAYDLAAEGDALVATRKLGAALRAYRRAVAVAPYWSEARHNLAVLLAAAGLYREAGVHMGWFLELAPSSPRADKARALRADWAALGGPP